MSKTTERQRLIRLYRDEIGESEVDMRKVAEFAVRKGWPLPKPLDPLDALAKLFAEAARLEVRQDKDTGRPYRANHAVPNRSPAGQMSFTWIDIDDPTVTPQKMRKSLVMRREQMIDDGLQLSLDMDHWNSIRSEDEYISLPMDLTLDVEIRRAALDEDDEAA
jgi:hypothetical protein